MTTSSDLLVLDMSDATNIHLQFENGWTFSILAREAKATDRNPNTHVECMAWDKDNRDFEGWHLRAMVFTADELPAQMDRIRKLER